MWGEQQEAGSPDADLCSAHMLFVPVAAHPSVRPSAAPSPLGLQQLVAEQNNNLRKSNNAAKKRGPV